MDLRMVLAFIRSTDVLTWDSMINEMNALTTRNNALRRAWGFEVAGVSDAFQSDMARRAGIGAGVGSILGASGAAYKQEAATGSWF